MLFPLLAAAVAREYRWPVQESGALPPEIRCAVVARKVGVEKALADFHEQRARGPATDFGPPALNTCGYLLLGMGQTDGAIHVFETNVTLFPQDFNAHDSLGEAYMTAGRKELAVKSYQRSLDLNPRNENAVKMLKKLQAN
jgi:Flp pilus assembly protein TadD